MRGCDSNVQSSADVVVNEAVCVCIPECGMVSGDMVVNDAKGGMTEQRWDYIVMCKRASRERRVEPPGAGKGQQRARGGLVCVCACVCLS